MRTEPKDPVGPREREARTGALPSVSVVVASCRPRELLEACLDALLPQCRAHGAEVIVARSEEAEGLESAYPDVIFLSAPRDSTVPLLRAAGMSVAEGDIVALTEDHCVVADDWLDELLRAHHGGSEVVGGAMDNARRRRTVDWAAFFAEYGFFADRGGGGAEDPKLTGANVSYVRRVVDEVTELASRGEWENVIHRRLAGAGRSLRFVESAAVCQNSSYGWWEFCRNRFEHGYGYARRRLVDEPAAVRWLYLAGSPALPWLLAWRIHRGLPSRHRGRFLRSLPVTLSFLVAWASGEAAGYVRGPAEAGDGP